MKLYFIHCGFYDEEISDGIYEFHGIDLDFIVGKNHYSRELALAGSRRSIDSNQIKKDAVTLPLPRFLKDGGSNSLTSGGP